jgi:hypothetical protein
MADSLVLGPGPQSHVVLNGPKEPVMLYRHKDGLGVRHAGEFQVDDQPCRDRAVLGPNSVVSGASFSFAVEPADRKK